MNITLHPRNDVLADDRSIGDILLINIKHFAIYLGSKTYRIAHIIKKDCLDRSSVFVPNYVFTETAYALCKQGIYIMVKPTFMQFFIYECLWCKSFGRSNTILKTVMASSLVYILPTIPTSFALLPITLGLIK